VREGVAADLRHGLRQSTEDLAIAALVVAPFSVAIGIWVGWLTWAPSWILIVLTLIVQAVATIWNAGWRARGAE
jgi:ABC-type Mn2+/Zn2+ transport system permease subunit